jgi:hypothetical protein
MDTKGSFLTYPLVRTQALRFNGTKEECLEAIDTGFQLSPRLASEAQNAVYKSALKTLELVRYDDALCLTACARLSAFNGWRPAFCTPWHCHDLTM